MQRLCLATVTVSAVMTGAEQSESPLRWRGEAGRVYLRRPCCRAGFQHSWRAEMTNSTSGSTGTRTLLFDSNRAKPEQEVTSPSLLIMWMLQKKQKRWRRDKQRTDMNPLDGKVLRCCAEICFPADACLLPPPPGGSNPNQCHRADNLLKQAAVYSDCGTV